MNYDELKKIASTHTRKGDNLPSNSLLLLTQLHIPYRTYAQYKSDFNNSNGLIYNSPAFLLVTDNDRTVYFNPNTKYWNFYIFHEIAHFILGHKDNSPQNEIDADLLACLLAAPAENLPSYIKSARDLSSLCQIPIDKAELYWQEIKPKNKRITITALPVVIAVLCIVFYSYILETSTHTDSSPVNTIQEGTTPSQDELANPVYITSSGERYHRQSCRYIKGKTDILEISESAAIDMGYQPCKICMGK